LGSNNTSYMRLHLWVTTLFQFGSGKSYLHDNPSPGFLIEAIGTIFLIVFGLLHLASAQFFKSKINSYSRRHTIIYWSIASLLVLLLASRGSALYRKA
jgi:glycerol uptake facilitator-like aquaporin